ncbi:metal ABC transporter ATP-binding protein [Aeromicrobium sp. Leaf350]|uniref:metal ABC transporter ATP-binding protein n=1 Tax=Aeromicrobium sp. Leaf350 TaxID=2876565 RepID=UPI001E369A31|nr:metal ABC transporter ATP-binding protein [Aeromicrobium sp. Leaf350]
MSPGTDGGAGGPALPEPVLQANGITVDLGGRSVLTSVDLTLGRGEVVAVLGANGSGKSTLVRAVIGLVPRRAGSVELFGTPLERFRDRARLGYVPQRSTGSTGVPATVREVVLSGRLARRRFLGPASRADKAAADRAIELVGLTPLRGRPVTELSGGQHQRTLIARALASEPELLVMDEPLAGVDAASGHQLARTVGDLVASGTAVLLVEHDLGPLTDVVDRAVVIDHGRVAYDGPAHGAPTEHVHHHPHDGEPARLQPLPGEGVL